ncbi:MAG: glutamyl-tRNA reductase [Flavobacteriales bacterium]
MEKLQVISLSHKNCPLDLIGRFHVEDARRGSFLLELKELMKVNELVYLSTCNRVEFIISTDVYFCGGRQNQLLDTFEITGSEKSTVLQAFESFQGEAAIHHLLKVGASLESMVLGEREIITQVRKAFDEGRTLGISGDLLRLTGKNVIETSKRVFTETAIATKPVSVVSLAWKNFKSRGHSSETPILIIGAGQTNSNFARFLKKSGYSNVTVANRTLEKAQTLVADTTGWKAVQLLHISQIEAFKVIVTCTGSENPIVTSTFLGNRAGENIDIIDMALPSDVSSEVTQMENVRYVGMQVLQAEATKNLAFRSKEIAACDAILKASIQLFKDQLKQRKIELAMREIPQTIKDIRETAMGEVFAKELDLLDESSRKVLEKILGYMEKKYISVPMKLAKKVILENTKTNCN